MPSYQDTNWGYGNDAPVTDNPLPISELNRHLARFGYQMEPINHLSPMPIRQWTKKDATPITMAAPQFKAEGYYDELVYDLDDVRDMLAHLNSGGVDVGDGHELVAKKRTVGC